MELTEKERSMLTRKQEEICGLTIWIIDHASDPENEIQLKKNFTTIISLLNQISAYSRTDYHLNNLTEAINSLYMLMKQEKLSKTWLLSPIAIDRLCNYLNSVHFQFGKDGIKINLPKINLNVGHITNQ